MITGLSTPVHPVSTGRGALGAAAGHPQAAAPPPRNAALYRRILWRVPGSEALVDAGGLTRLILKIAAMPAKEAEGTLTGVKKILQKEISLFLSPPGLPPGALSTQDLERRLATGVNDTL